VPHSRERHLYQHIKKTLTWSPAVGLYGLRQVGKTTLAQSLTGAQNGFFETLDLSNTLLASENRPRDFLERPRLLCIDEVQKGPWLFPVIKDIVGTRRAPGKFLLTGSVRFTLKKDIQEALTGRLLLFELLPFTVSESHQKPESKFLSHVFATLKGQKKKQDTGDAILEKVCKDDRSRRISSRLLHSHALLGGMPISCFTRDEFKRKRWQQDYFETMLTRDVALVDHGLAGLPYAQGLSFLRALSLRHGEEINISDLARSSALPMQVAKKLLSALHVLCLLDLIVPEPHAGKSGKKLRVEWKDVGLWGYFQNVTPEFFHEDATILSLMLSHEFRAQIGVMPQALGWTFYKSHDGANIPWIFRQGNLCLASAYLPTENPQPYHYRALKQLIQREKNGLGIIFGSDKAPFLQIDKNILLMPARAVF